MGCYICGKAADFEQQKGRKICDRCFCFGLERRIRSNIRLNNIFSKGDRIYTQGELSKFLIKKIYGNLIKFTDKKKANKFVEEWSLDDEICCFLDNFFQGKAFKNKGKSVSILRVATDEELTKFSSLNKIRFKTNPKNKEVLEIIKDISKKHTGANFTLAKNIDMLNKITNNRFKCF
jgi:hypothetical protein